MNVEGAIAQYRRVREAGLEKARAERERRPTPAEREARHKELEAKVREIVAALDPEGRWTRRDAIQSRLFIANMETLCE
jgi:hypothetical protein